MNYNASEHRYNTKYKHPCSKNAFNYYCITFFCTFSEHIQAKTLKWCKITIRNSTNKLLLLINKQNAFINIIFFFRIDQLLFGT